MNITRRTAGREKADGFPGTLRVEDCELHVENGKLSVTFRLSLPPSAAVIVPTPRRVPPRPSNSKP